MRHRFIRTAAMLIVMALLLPSLAACGTGTLGGVTPTPVAGRTPCPTDVVDATAEPTAQAEGTVIPRATSTPGSSGDAPSYAEVDAKLEALRKILAGINTPEQYEQQQAEIEKAKEELADAWNALAEKHVKGWEGWVIATGKDAVGTSLKIWYEMPEEIIGEEDVVLLSLIDPFAVDQIKPTAPKAVGMIQSYAAPEPFVVVRKPSTSDGRGLCLGQKVTFEGVVDKAFYLDYSMGMYLRQASLSIIEDKLGGVNAPADLNGVAVRLERTLCFGFCPDYEVTVFGNGLVLFHGRQYTRVQGFRIATVDEATVRKLLDALDKAGFDTMRSYTNYEVTDNPSTYITVVRGGKTHSVEHYHGDSSAPEELTKLEESIDEILNTAQWVK